MEMMNRQMVSGKAIIEEWNNKLLNYFKSYILANRRILMVNFTSKSEQEVMTLRNSIFAFLLIALLVFAAGCSKPESRLVGKWVGQTGSLEFFSNKTGVINPPAWRKDLPVNTRFTWKVEGNDTVTMIIDVQGGRTAFGKLEGKDALIVEDDKFVKQK